MKRQAEVMRNTAETQISVFLCLDGEGTAEINSGVGFLNHMLTLFARHGGFDLRVMCKGDTCVDDHHSVEDIGIALGEAFAQAIGDKRGIRRYASLCLPMDEALILCAVDISGRATLVNALTFPTEKIGSFDTQLVEEFFLGFVRKAEISLHLRQFCGSNSHHIAEAAFKGFGRALREAVSIDAARAGEIPSTKGVL